MLPQPREGEGPSIAHAYVEGLFVPALLLPLVEPVRQDKAPAFAKGRPEGGLGRRSLGLGVDELIPDAAILRLGGDEPPAVPPGVALGFRRFCHDDQGLLRGGMLYRGVQAGTSHKSIALSTSLQDTRSWDRPTL